ncbi:lysine N(6)-hydroxylase/L-ornithine N(5)-oxygenase family protein [Pseudalkalibacillus caeni]|uniref:L-lysine N6-monooxygenase MbtG n=1 Tax=Exobacillus caeni TaxID=2574798 RepID=A0A5R9F7L2_9BACL|nr:SidA/IucD/PvdA family monooxygenase [Pseudalkalibacillus caeni]TLS35755.1 ornithine monooxygenase [Pseudalkalibacillus caeni]
MSDQKIYDLIGIGIGPFNLSLAALIEPIDEIEALFFDKSKEFDWHTGMLIEGSDLQVPFLADLVTLADPTSSFSFLNYLRFHNRLYQFYFFNRFDIPRKEYNEYAKWVAAQLESCRFGWQVIDVIEHQEENPHYEIVVYNEESRLKESYLARHIVLGTGGVPNIPEGFKGYPGKDVIHTSQFLDKVKEAKDSKAITVVGSGQSAAEVFYELLQEQDRHNYKLTWFTRSAGFLQLESAKLGQEVFSPDYVEYFHALPFEQRVEALPKLGQLRKGVDPETLKQIYNLLYHRSIGRKHMNVRIQPATEVKGIETAPEGNSYILKCRQWQEGRSFEYQTDKVFLATGYKPHVPEWINRYRDQMEWEDKKRYKITDDYRLVFKDDRPNQIFTVTNIEHSHGAGATNLGLSVHRNQQIINRVAGKEIYPLMEDTIFQTFSSKEL